MWKLEYELSNTSPEYVFGWLKDNQVEAHDWGNDRLNLEESLLARDNKLINLGLALYAEESAIGYALYRSGDSALKRSALSGRTIRPKSIGKSWVLNDDVIPALIEIEKDRLTSDNQDEKEISLLNELLQNPLIPDDLLEAVFKKSDPFSDLDDDLWIHFVSMTYQNERLSTPYNETWMDGYTEYLYNAVFFAGWKLFEKSPVNSSYAKILWAFSYKLHPEIHDLDILKTIERWRSDDETEEMVYSLVRTGLVKALPNHSDGFKELEESEDLALREGYYAHVRGVKSEDVAKWFERDGEKFLDSALQNSNFFRDGGVRAAFRQACWDAPDERGYMDYPNHFNSKEKHWTTKYPELFKDSRSKEIPFDEIEDPDERKERRLKYLSSQVSDLKKAIVGDEDFYEDTQNPNGFDVQTAFTNIVVQVDLLNSQLQEFYRRNSFSWGTLLAGLVVGFIVASYV